VVHFSDIEKTDQPNVLNIYFIFNVAMLMHSCTLLVTKHFQTIWFKSKDYA